MTKRKHPDTKLTLREFYEKHYDNSDLAHATVKWHRYVLNKWEAMTDNPPIGKIDDETLIGFKKSCLEGGSTAKTINQYWTLVRSVLRRAGPQFTGNPQGRGIIDRVPYMKKIRVRRSSPTRVPMEDLSKFYISCRNAQFPKMTAFPAAWWWQCMLVLALYTGIRRGDLFRIRRQDIDLESATLFIESQKTLKADVFPLPAVAVEHIRRIWEPDRNRLFLSRGMNLWGGAFSRRWKAICQHAKIKPFLFKSLRSTAASEAEKIRPGAAELLLQHARHDVTGKHYLSLDDVLRDVVEQMPVPLAFKHGINMDLKAREKSQKEIVRMMPRDFATPRRPDPSEWRFEPSSFCFRGEWYSAVGAPLRVLHALALAEGPVDVLTLATAVWGNEPWPREFYRVAGRVAGICSKLRVKLRQVLRVGDNWNPVVCIDRGAGGRWSLLFPPECGKAA